jgi:hypothetical protein
MCTGFKLSQPRNRSGSTNFPQQFSVDDLAYSTAHLLNFFSQLVGCVAPGQDLLRKS